jgi:MFS family permease
MIIATLTVGRFLDWYLHKTSSNRSSLGARLPPMVLGTALCPIGILTFGWSVQHKVHWIAPIILASPVGFAYVSIAISAWTYLLDVFGIYAASATAGTVLLRNAGAACLPLASPSLVQKVDWGWGFTVLAFLGFVTVPIPAFLMYRGERVRLSKSLEEFRIEAV